MLHQNTVDITVTHSYDDFIHIFTHLSRNGFSNPYQLDESISKLRVVREYLFIHIQF